MNQEGWGWGGVEKLNEPKRLGFGGREGLEEGGGGGEEAE